MIDLLPTPVLARIIAFMGCGSDGWRNLSLVSKAVCCRVNIEKLRLLLPGSSLEWDYTLHRLGQRHFQPHQLQVILDGDYQVQQVGQKLRQLLQQTHLLQNLHTFRVRGFDVSDAALTELAAAAPWLQQLFLEGVTVGDDQTSSSDSVQHRSEQEQPQALQLTAVTATVPALCQAVQGSMWCKVSVKKSSQAHTAEQQIAQVLSQFQHLHTLRMDSAIAEGVMRQLCESLGGSADAMQSNLYIEHCTPGPQIVHIPCLGWYLFRAAGSKRITVNRPSNSATATAAAAGIAGLCVSGAQMVMVTASESDSSSSSSSSIQAGCGHGSATGRSPSPAVSCPGDLHSDNQELSMAGAQTADNASKTHMQCKEDSAANSSESLSRSSSIGRHSLDLHRCLAACVIDPAGDTSAGSVNIVGTCDDDRPDACGAGAGHVDQGADECRQLGASKQKVHQHQQHALNCSLNGEGCDCAYRMLGCAEAEVQQVNDQ